MDKTQKKSLKGSIEAYDRFTGQADMLKINIDGLNERRKAEGLAKSEVKKLSIELQKKLQVYHDIRDTAMHYRKEILKTYRKFGDAIPEENRDWIHKTFAYELEHPSEQEDSDKDESKVVDKNHPWLPIKVPRRRIKIAPKEEIGSVVVNYYENSVHKDHREVFDKLADYFFYVYFEKGEYKLKQHMQGTNYFRRIHREARAGWESKLAWLSAIYFYPELVASDFEDLLLTSQKTAEMRQKARQKLQSFERNQIENLADLGETFYRHYDQAQGFKESVQHAQYLKQQQAEKNKARKSTSVQKNIKKTPSARTVPNKECHKILTELILKLKAGQIATTDCSELTKYANSLKVHNSSTRTQKLLHLKLTQELHRVIDDMVRGERNKMN